MYKHIICLHPLGRFYN